MNIPPINPEFNFFYNKHIDESSEYIRQIWGITNPDNEQLTLSKFQTDYIKNKTPTSIDMALEIIRTQPSNINNVNANANVNQRRQENELYHFPKYHISQVISKYRGLLKRLNDPLTETELAQLFVDFARSMGIDNLTTYIKQQNVVYNRQEIVFDVFLELFYNAPISNDQLINYIYFLRKFDLFKNIFTKWFQSSQINMEDIETRAMVDVSENDNIFNIETHLPITSANYTLLLNQIPNMHNYVFNMPFIEWQNETINLREYGFTENTSRWPYVLSNLPLFYEKNWNAANTNDLLNILIRISYPLDIIHTNPGVSRVCLSNVLLQLFFLNKYLKLNEINSLDYFKEKFDVPSRPGLTGQTEGNLHKMSFVPYMLLSYLLFRGDNNALYKKIDTIVTRFASYLYLVTTFKTTNNPLLPLFFFLEFSDSNTIVLSKYTKLDHPFLLELIDLYQKYYPGDKKIINC
ncbi:hypothetical protein DLEV_053 [Diachasmimorpha longicaudata entomopoxvirus]|uniref:DED domain-containing protein n=1 Tax=Diachasmimorpha longicaudata entomopoxvirus TaxID=109981 RepID=A0A7R5WME2_9POXV|nr:hypothetical protein QKK69_gp053 [Diachasmimorpha longicaudata entomopoxvirus]AKS26344.1 hypothetical protein DLEV_053 [Diachasmimorpha longicaudata entomopoxvirus]